MSEFQNFLLSVDVDLFIVCSFGCTERAGV